MAVAMTDRPDLRRMAFSLPIEEDWPPVSVETLWVEAAKNGTYRVDSVPFLVKGIAVDDIVEGRTQDEGEPVMSRNSVAILKEARGPHFSASIFPILR
jgi:hypothetical protein